MQSLNSQKLTKSIEYVDKWIAINFKNGRLPGLQVAIQYEDTIMYSKAFGYANIDKKAALTAKSIFRIASQSKTFTATAIFQLVELGKIALDNKVSDYLDWFKSSEDERVSDVTLRQLLNHTAGILRDGLDSDYWRLSHDFPKEDALREFVSTSRLAYDSDTKFKYSNFGYGFLGLVIEQVSGLSYKKYMESNIINTLSLNSTGSDIDEEALKFIAEGYGLELFHTKRKAFAHAHTYALSPATGFYSTAEDVCRYFSAHFLGNNLLLKDASKRQMQHGYWEAKEDGEKYGLGMIKYPKKGWNLFGHSGGFPGFVTNTQFEPQKKLVVSVFINSSDGNPTMVAKQIIGIIDTFQQDTDTIKLPFEDIEKFEGTFYANWGATDIVAVGKKLFSINPLGWSGFDTAEELIVKDKNTLYIENASGYSAPGESVTYTFDAGNQVKSLRYGGGTLLKYDDAVKQGWL